MYAPSWVLEVRRTPVGVGGPNCLRLHLRWRALWLLTLESVSLWEWVYVKSLRVYVSNFRSLSIPGRGVHRQVVKQGNQRLDKDDSWATHYATAYAFGRPARQSSAPTQSAALGTGKHDSGMRFSQKQIPRLLCTWRKAGVLLTFVRVPFGIKTLK